jgi:hypothetical protein
MLISAQSHLGYLINNNLTNDDDISSPRYSFIGQANNFLCHFSKLDFLLFNLPMNKGVKLPHTPIFSLPPPNSLELAGALS